MSSAMAACYTGFEVPRLPSLPHKDYSRPLHVDCSVEYELPNQAKPPEGGPAEPLLMIHPCYYRRAESQRRSPFVNNLPTRGLVPAGRRQPRQYPPVRFDPQHHPQQQQQQQQHAWSLPHPQQQGPLSVYPKPAAAAAAAAAASKAASGKRDALLCGGGDFSSGSDSGISMNAGQWTPSERSPDAPRLAHRDFQTTDSGVPTPASLDDKTTTLLSVDSLAGQEAGDAFLRALYLRTRELEMEAQACCQLASLLHQQQQQQQQQQQRYSCCEAVSSLAHLPGRNVVTHAAVPL